METNTIKAGICCALVALGVMVSASADAQRALPARAAEPVDMVKRAEQLKSHQ